LDPHPHFYLPSKNGKRFHEISFWKTIPFSVSTHEKKSLQKLIIIPPDMEVQTLKKILSNVHKDGGPPPAFPSAKGKW
jgi:hypothetical protein